MVLYGHGKSDMVCMILCGLVWLSIVYYANVFPCKVSNGLVWLCTDLNSLTQLCTIFVLVLTQYTKPYPSRRGEPKLNSKPKVESLSKLNTPDSSLVCLYDH